MNYYLGPWVWDTSSLPCWRQPAGSVASIDLGTLAEQTDNPGSDRPGGFFASPVPLGAAYALVGFGTDLREIVVDTPARNAWRAVTGYRPQGNTVADMLWDHLMTGSDPAGLTACRPIMPTTQRRLELYFGNQEIKGESFVWGVHPATAKVQANLRYDFARFFDDAHGGRLNDDKHHLRVLDYWCEKYQLNGADDWKQLVPPGLLRDVPGRVKHQTSLSENFTGTDGAALGPSMTWTASGGTWDILSNRAHKGGTTGFDGTARADSALSSADHYSQVTDRCGSKFYAVSPVANMPTPAAATGYIGYNYDNTNSLLKIVAAATTDIGGGSSAQTWVTGQVRKVEANGSTIKLYVDGVEKKSGTDSANNGLYTGIFIYDHPIEGQMDDFLAADLAAGTIVPVFMNQYRQRRA